MSLKPNVTILNIPSARVSDEMFGFLHPRKMADGVQKVGFC